MTPEQAARRAAYSDRTERRRSPIRAAVMAVMPYRDVMTAAVLRAAVRILIGPCEYTSIMGYVAEQCHPRDPLERVGRGAYRRRHPHVPGGDR